MNENPFLKILSIVAFVAFAAISCWATTESLYLLLQGTKFPLIACWVVTIGFFILASYGSKLIVDALNTKVYIENRKSRLVGGVILLLFFWLFMSMPTNTHTFFYRNVASEVIQDDLGKTIEYVDQAKEQRGINEIVMKEVSDYSLSVDKAANALCDQIVDPHNPGLGNKSREHLQQLSSLGIYLTDFREPANKSLASLQYWCEHTIRQAIDRQKEVNINEIIAKHQTEFLTDAAKEQIDIVAENLKRCQVGLSEMIHDGEFPNWEVSKKVLPTIKDGYNVIKNQRSQILFKSDEDKQFYIESETTKSAALNSVFDVWKNFLAGEYKGRGFFFWVLISILVDLAAFLFFDLAFKQKGF